MDIEDNLRRYLADREDPSGRYASFDYCYNYFQAFHETSVEALVEPALLQTSCLQLGFFLASWGMFRGRAKVLDRSMRCFVPVIEAIVEAPAAVWGIDADGYTADAVETILQVGDSLSHVLPGGRSQTLVTKTMLGVFGCVPAFDTYFTRGLRYFTPRRGVGTFGRTALGILREFYEANTEIIQSHRVPTCNFNNDQPTKRRYSRAKVIDMIFYIEGGGGA